MKKYKFFVTYKSKSGGEIRTGLILFYSQLLIPWPNNIKQYWQGQFWINSAATFDTSCTFCCLMYFKLHYIQASERPCTFYLYLHDWMNELIMWSRCQPQTEGRYMWVCVCLCVCVCGKMGKTRWICTSTIVCWDLEPFYTQLHTNIH